MKVSLDRTALLRTLNHVQSVVERRNTIPILANILIEADSGALRLTATDLDIEITDTAEADISQPGRVTAPAHTFFDVVRKMRDGAQIELVVEKDNRISISAGRSHFELPTLPAEDFQTMSREEAPVSFEIDGGDLARLIDKTSFAISTEETRYYLNGIYFHTAKGTDGAVLRSVATDGHRLALCDSALPEGAAELSGIIIPRKAVSEIRRLLEGSQNAVQIEASEAKISFSIGDATLTTKLIDGSFPDYDRVIPKGNDKLAGLHTQEFSEAVDRVATVSAEKSRSVKLGFDENIVNISVHNVESGLGEEELTASYTHEPISIGFNARYLLEIAARVGGDDLIIELADTSAPALLRDNDDGDALYVLMPLRV